MSLLPEVSTCQAPIQQGIRKGQPCGNKSIGLYCNKHKRQSIIDKSVMEDIRYCDVARGCYTPLEAHQVKCTNCLHKSRILDRKREDKKRQDPNLCLDCGREFNTSTVIKAKGKHDKHLRRCEPCYEKLKKIEAERPVRERQYKAEAFTNKHVIWNHYVKGAQKRGIHFALTKTKFNELILQPCFYCNYKKDMEVNGIDRVDNNKGYQEDNVVSCCESCNVMKGSQHPQEFIDKLQAIHLFQTTAIPISEITVEKWKTTYKSKSTANYKSYSKNANTRNIQFLLSEEEFKEIVAEPCYLCGLKGSSGIDRFNNKIGYLKENCRACCGHCNLLKKDLQYEDIIRIAAVINYVELSAFLDLKQIHIRSSKIDARIKVENPLLEEAIPLEYKALNEIIIPREIPDEIKEILEKKDECPAPKQWKTKQIYDAIQSNQAHLYKQFCEENNESKEWLTSWPMLLEQTKGSKEDAEKAIKEFINNLRRIRHNTLCASKSDVVEREDREQWPATTVVKAFLEGKMDKFKAYTETHTSESLDDPKWIKRWSTYIESLNKNRDNALVLKELCSKFMTAQRTKKYRTKK